MKPMNNTIPACVAVAALWLAPAWAWSADADINPIAASLKQRYPNTRIDAVRPSPIASLYEVVMGKNVVYASADGRYVLFGHLFDMQEQTDLTARLKQGEQRPPIEVSTLPLEDAVTDVHGQGKRLLTIFTDPLCPHCQELDRALAVLSDVTIRRYVVSLIEPTNDTDRQRVLRACGLADKDTCSLRLTRNRALFDLLNLPGTPALINRQGSLLLGVQALEDIDSWLDKAEPRAESVREAP